MHKKYRLIDWHRVNWYPLFDPPKGAECEAINVARYFAKLPYFDFARQTLIDKPPEELTLQEAEEVEDWVDETRDYQWRYTWSEIKEFERQSPDTMHGFFDHFIRIGHHRDTIPGEDGEKYFYRQSTARQFLKNELKTATIAAVGFLVCCGVLLQAHDFDVSSLLSILWSGIKTSAYWIADIAAPVVFVGATAWHAGRWIKRAVTGRKGRKKLDE